MIPTVSSLNHHVDGKETLKTLLTLQCFELTQIEWWQKGIKQDIE